MSKRDALTQAGLLQSQGIEKKAFLG